MTRPPKFDDRDRAILHERTDAYLDRSGPQVGHWVEFADGTLRRISHVWTHHIDEPSTQGIQTSDGGSFYLGPGYMSFSGGLYPGIPAYTLRPTDRLKPGQAWFFHHNDARAHNGVPVAVECPLWTCTRPANQ